MTSAQHHDQYENTSKGVAAMIDVARALVKSKCQLKYSVIFVAFDKEEVAVMILLSLYISQFFCHV